MENLNTHIARAIWVSEMEDKMHQIPGAIAEEVLGTQIKKGERYRLKIVDGNIFLHRNNHKKFISSIEDYKPIDETATKIMKDVELLRSIDAPSKKIRYARFVRKKKSIKGVI